MRNTNQFPRDKKKLSVLLLISVAPSLQATVLMFILDI